MALIEMRIGVLYEHPEWFAPLFAELDRRRISYDPVHAARLNFDPGRRPPYALVVNRMSPSAYVRRHAHAIFASLSYLHHLEIAGVPVVNGTAAFGLELSKTAQMSLLGRLGLPYPRTRVINDASRAADAATDLTFPILLKPNIGGSGAKIQRFDSMPELEAAVAAGVIDLGIDHTALVQEFHAPAGDHIVRVEILDGRFLYAIKVFPNLAAGFNLCPADICQTLEDPGTTAEVAARPEVPRLVDADLCPVDLPKTNLRVEGYTPPHEIVTEALRIAEAARLDVCGIEYLVSRRDGQRYFYDINALSNFVTDAPRVVGFDPFPVFVDYLERRARRALAAPATTAP
jgi:glutathione synthase/RimK-type ligase-like ATP-grasp enzyme